MHVFAILSSACLERYCILGRGRFCGGPYCVSSRVVRHAAQRIKDRWTQFGIAGLSYTTITMNIHHHHHHHHNALSRSPTASYIK